MGWTKAHLARTLLTFATIMKTVKKLKIAFLVVVLPLLAYTAAHKFYISVTNVNYSEKDAAVQITTRMFLDDMNAVLKERYGIPSALGTEDESELHATYFEKYLRSKFLVAINGKQVEYTLLGKKYDTDMVSAYIELPGVSLATLKSLEITNEVLTDLFEEQQNVVHFKVNGKKKSYVLLKSSPKGMLNL
jgi:hypothetical protein